MDKIYLLDAYALIYRSYYAFMSRPMHNRKGINTSAIFGFTKFLRDLIVRETPRYLGVAFDPKGGSFRKELFPAYKANRSETPEDIIVAVPYIKSILEAMRIPCLEVAGYEADDVIGTLSVRAAAEGYEVYMVTPDKDFGQLLQPNVYIYRQGKSGDGVEIIGAEQIKEKYGIADPQQVIDILALWGDAADNIPGVAGIGEKGAAKLVGEFGTVENIIANIDKLKGRQRENIIAGEEQLRLSKRLATIETDVPVEFSVEALRMSDPDCDRLRELYTELDFNMFLREMDGSRPTPFNKALCTGASAGVVQNSGTETTTGETVGAGNTTVQYDLFGAPMQSDLFGGDKIVGSDSRQTTADTEGASDVFSGAYKNISFSEHIYTTISGDDEIASLVARLTEVGEFAFALKTTSERCTDCRIVGVAFSTAEGKAWYIHVADDEQHRLHLLKPLFENPDIAKISHDIKFPIMALARAGITLNGFKYDTMLLHYLLDPESRHTMDYLSRLYLDYLPVEIESLTGRGARQLTIDLLAPEQLAEYCAEYADIVFRLRNILWPKVVSAGLEPLYRRIEEPLIEVLADMELTGVKIDAEQLAEYGRELTVEMERLEAHIRELTGLPDLNVNSSRQLGVALFEKLRITAKPKRTKTKQYSTDEEYLTTLIDRHPVVEMVLEYRTLKKLLSTYIEALPQMADSETGRIHTSFNQAVTATGRLSSTNPNLQNIPIRTEQGRRIRKAFVPSEAGRQILSADYSQVELRLMAHLSGDKALIEAFRNGEDIHSATASRLFGVPLAEVTAEQRRKAKTVNFGIIYGISAFGLKQRMRNMTLEEARATIEGYFKAYPQVREYMDRVVEEARERGYVETLFGRRRYLPDIRSANSTVRSLAERNAINAPLQGSAADIIKLAMIAVYREFRTRGLQSKLILQVHDELVIDMLECERTEVETIVVDAMHNAAVLSVELAVDCGVGADWLEAH